MSVRWSRWASAGLALALAAGGGCGAGVGTEAPAGRYPDEPSSCDADQTLLHHTEAAAAEGVLDDLGPHVEELLVDGRGLIPWVRSVKSVGAAVGVDGLLGLSAGWADGEGLGRLTPHLQQVMLYIRGRSPYVAGEHDAVVEVGHRILVSQGARCNSIGWLSTVRDIAAAEHPVGQPLIQVLFDDVRALAEDQAFVTLLADLTFDDDGGAGQPAVGGDAFVLIVNLVIGYISAPDFDPGVARDLIADVLVSQFAIAPQTEARLNLLLDDLDLLIAVDAPTLPGIQDLLACVRTTDEEGILAGMVYDYVQIEALSLPGFLADLELFADSAAGESLRRLFADGIDALLDQPETTRDSLQVLGAFVAPERRADVLDALLALRGRGVAHEVFAAASALSQGCEASP